MICTTCLRYTKVWHMCDEETTEINRCPECYETSQCKATHEEGCDTTVYSDEE